MPGPETPAARDLVSALGRSLPDDYLLRARTEDDLEFLSVLYASTRAQELSVVPWSEVQKAAFLHDQFQKQHAHYLQHYPRAHWLVIEHRGAPVGRLYVEPGARDMRVMDIALLPEARNKGIGTCLMEALVDQADEAGVTVSLHVEPYNPARQLYRRLGLVDVETRGYYLFMERPARSPPS